MILKYYLGCVLRGYVINNERPAAGCQYNSSGHTLPAMSNTKLKQVRKNDTFHRIKRQEYNTGGKIYKSRGQDAKEALVCVYQ